MPEKVLVVAAHPDDEILGCGGAMARHAEQGDDVHILIVAEGATSRQPNVSNGDKIREEVLRLRAAAVEAAKIVGVNTPRLLGLPDNRLDTLALLDVIQPIENVIEELSPSIVYTHDGGDLNVDHRVVYQAVVTACRPLPGQPVRAIYSFEVMSSTEWGGDPFFRFSPNRFVDITRYLGRKIEALRCYDMEMRAFPHARSLKAVEALAVYRGASAGLEAAECFHTVRELVVDGR